MSELTPTYEAEHQPGFRISENTVILGHGSSLWSFVSTEILRWGVKTRSGFSVESGAPSNRGSVGSPVVVGDRWWLVARLGSFRLHEPVQILEVVDRPELKGFTYGTLAGHPVRGRETFLVRHEPDDSVHLTIRSCTRPAPGPWRLVFPIALLAQRFYRKRYLRALSG
ncbi:DUF1990 domain-containing protein [Kribbella speibonae]|uniref:DUF1990 domain-containing protein n=1 Tax=Kribbella speibonae TaxID=1572660 RepID=A0ABY2AH62_9ACTN|nr:DUF1990 domain-containing protein [Kribbella speibonae]